MPPYKNSLVVSIAINKLLSFCFRAMLEKGRISWRLHDQIKDVFIMNDVNVKTGNLLSNSFVEIQRNRNTYTCQCQMYTMLTNAGEDDIQCMHIKFVKSVIETNVNVLFSPASHLQDSHTIQVLKKALGDLNYHVVRLDNNKRFHRFSVLTEENPQSCAIVTLERNRFHCRNGLCGSKRGHVRKHQRLGSPDDCPHLKLLAQHREVWQFLIPGSQDNSHKVKPCNSNVIVCILQQLQCEYTASCPTVLSL